MAHLSSPLERYRCDLQQPDFSYDVAQQHAVEKLDELCQRLAVSVQSKKTFAGRCKQWLCRLAGYRPAVLPEKGLYLWGGVGRGKTYLMDIFYQALPFDAKLRVHFHRFMRSVHQQLAELQGEKNPLDIIAAGLAERVRVICFDEFFVSDITDTMLLAGLFDALFARGVCLVATSNFVPDDLYKDGLQRQHFVPTINLLNTHTDVINVDGGVDYRLRTLERAQLYYAPIDAATEEKMLHCFHQLAPAGTREFVCIASDVSLEIEGRYLTALYLVDDVVWFEFSELCAGPRSQHDYIELAKEFHAVLVANVPQMGSHNEDVARRFILMVDEFYDSRIKLVISAEVEIDNLYSEGRQAFEFSRTRSRLHEMQSHDYLAAPHRA